MNDAALQRALIARAFDLGTGGPSGRGDDGVRGPKTRAALRAFQTATGLPATGEPDTATLAALGLATTDEPVSGAVDPVWMPAATMARIIVHWSAGAHVASNLDRSHYHLMIEGDGGLVRGLHSIKANERPAGGAYAAHTLNCNTGSIGVSLCCMAGAVEHPFQVGTAPMTRAQWDRLPEVLAALCQRYGIPLTPQTVLSHAEVQANLGIKQRGKWDIARLAFDPSVVGAEACGDLFRAGTAAALARLTGR